MILCEREIEAISARQAGGTFHARDAVWLLAVVRRLQRWANAGMLAAVVRDDGDKLQQVAGQLGELLDEDADLPGCPCRWCYGGDSHE